MNGSMMVRSDGHASYRDTVAELDLDMPSRAMLDGTARLGLGLKKGPVA